eukprot:CAMPEP_0118919728 /NCGR_PEP_ID=MMETSP1166-20130328/18707_1 /TAXON_ID=1104430 /ORGANISM="Chrysoreinhardia sp, Strain CCMP3193" /LENGTH=87 /DNA_ID=CAMNT_0006860259 /DNA_START=85 /DNA_END=345 /DNA_ORIENTATION=-
MSRRSRDISLAHWRAFGRMGHSVKNNDHADATNKRTLRTSGNIVNRLSGKGRRETESVAAALETVLEHSFATQAPGSPLRLLAADRP